MGSAKLLTAPNQTTADPPPNPGSRIRGIEWRYLQITDAVVAPVEGGSSNDTHSRIDNRVDQSRSGTRTIDDAWNSVHRNGIAIGDRFGYLVGEFWFWALLGRAGEAYDASL